MRIADQISAFLYRNRIRGATRFHATACRGRRIEVQTRHGVTLRLDPFEYIDHLIIKHGYYEEEVLQAILEALQPKQVFWDIGANLGIHSLTVRARNPKSSVFAFEPNPKMASLISDAATANRLHVEVCPVALDSEHGEADFFLHAGNAGRSGLHNWDNDPSLESIQVPTRRGDDFIEQEQAQAPHVIKIDVEGHEAAVLKGLARTLAGQALHTIVFEDSSDPESPVKRLLREYNFFISVLSRREPTHHDLENFKATR